MAMYPLQDRIRKARVARGVCWNCNSPVVPGKTRCSAHLKRERDRHHAQHTCLECGATYRGDECAFCGPVVEDSDGVMSLTDVFGG